jgi:hypothetical protein
MKYEFTSYDHMTADLVVPAGIESLIPCLPEGTRLRGKHVEWEEDAKGKLVRLAVYFEPPPPSEPSEPSGRKKAVKAVTKRGKR